MSEDGHAAIRGALKQELESRGYTVAKDTVSARGELYVLGEGDSAAALFEFKQTADEACQTMYQGRWLPTMPPRFAVLPTAEANSDGVDFLTQAGLRVLFYESQDGGVAFVAIDEALDDIYRRSAKLG